MKTEEYIIILVGYAPDHKEISITYNAKGPVVARIEDHEGAISGETEPLPAGLKQICSLPASGWNSGSYTCHLVLDGKIMDSKPFDIE